jgi:hypothetical protein
MYMHMSMCMAMYIACVHVCHIHLCAVDGIAIGHGAWSDAWSLTWKLLNASWIVILTVLDTYLYAAAGC